MKRSSSSTVALVTLSPKAPSRSMNSCVWLSRSQARRTRSLLSDCRALKHDLPLDPDRPQEHLVVADGDQRAVESLQRIFQFFDRGEIEMVGRLVQQQEERWPRACEDAGEACAQPFAA